MRLRDQVIGALNLFRAVAGALTPRTSHRPGTGRRGHHQHAARAQHAPQQAPDEQLQTALNSRVIIEQAKGKLAERLGLDMDQAFSVLRDHARRTGCPLLTVARQIVDGDTSPAGLTRG